MSCYPPAGDSRSTLADGALNFRVRNGNGCDNPSMGTGKRGPDLPDGCRDARRTLGSGRIGEREKRTSLTEN